MPAIAAAAGGGGAAAGGGAAGGGAAGGGAAGGGAAGGGAAGGGAAGGGAAGGGGSATQLAPNPAGQGGQQAPNQVPAEWMPRGGGSDEDDQKGGLTGGKGVFVMVVSLGLLLLIVIVTFMPLFLIAGIVGGDAASEETCSGSECTIAGDIPPLAVPFKEIYSDAAKVYRVNPYLLMAVHEDESTYGTGRGTGITDGLNYAGCCAGPMQFSIAGDASNTLGGSGGTWAGYATAYKKATMQRPPTYPNMYAPHPNVYDSFDAIYAAAKYFHSLGVGPTLDERTLAALRRYKGTPPYSEPFAQHDYKRARELEALGQQGFAGPLPSGPRGVIDSRTGSALPPASAPDAVKGIYQAANGIHTKPYYMVHFPTHIGNPTYDCSSSTSHALWGGRLFGAVPWVATQFQDYGEPGVGRWVTVWYRPGSGGAGHVFLVVAGLRFDTSRWNGDNAVPSGSGPRWTANLTPLRYMASEGFYPRHPRGL